MMHERHHAIAGLEPDEFVEDMKRKGIRVPGIGHRIKSKVCDWLAQVLSLIHHSWLMLGWSPLGLGGGCCKGGPE